MKFRKLISLVLAVALLAVPALSLGESAASASFLDKAYEAGRNVKTTVTFTPGAIFAMDPDLSMVADLLKVLKIESYSQQQGETSLEQVELFLQDKSSLAMMFLMKDDEFHILSNLLGGNVLSFTMEEFFDFYITMIASSMKGSTLDPDQLELFRESLKESMKQSLAQQQEFAGMGELSIAEYMGFDKDSAQKDLADPLTAWYEGIISKGESAAGAFESEKHDAAVTRKVSTISGAQIQEALEIFSNWAVQDKNLDKIVEMANSNSVAAGTATSREEVRRMFLSLPSEFEKEAGNIPADFITITELTDAAGVRKALEIKVEVPEGTEENTTVSLTFGQYEKTEEDGVVSRYDFDAASAQEGFSVSYAGKDIAAQSVGDAAVTKSQWALTGSYKSRGLTMGSLSLAFESKNTAAATKVQDEWKLGVDLTGSGMAVNASLTGKEETVLEGVDAKAEGTVDLYIFGASEPACSIAYTTISGEPAALPEIPADSVRLGKMTEEELQAWAEEMVPVVQGQLMSVIGNLPLSIQKLIFSGAAMR